MKINSIAIAIIIVLVLGGGIILTNSLNLWDKKPVYIPPEPTVITGDGSSPTTTKPDFNTPYQPAEIKGTNTFAEISMMFHVPLDDLGIGFGIMEERNWQDLKARELKAIYTNLPSNVKLETESVRIFISFYTGKAYKYSHTAYLPQPAVDILKQKAKLTVEQVAFLDSHTYTTGMATSSGVSKYKHVVTGETSFRTLLGWGIPAVEIERIIGGKIPDLDTSIRDYASQQDKDFLMLVSDIQELSNKY